jgi:hypothetical protein
MLQKRDLLWILAYPIYQIIGTIRHEGSHALVALLEGARVTEFVFWPSFTKYGFYWGYVRITGSTDWIFLAAHVAIDPQKMDLAQPCNHRNDIAVREFPL